MVQFTDNVEMIKGAAHKKNSDLNSTCKLIFNVNDKKFTCDNK